MARTLCYKVSWNVVQCSARCTTCIWVLLWNFNGGKWNQLKFIQQQKAKSHLQVGKMMTETINILFVIRSERNVRTSSMQDGDIAGLLWTDAKRRWTGRWQIYQHLPQRRQRDTGLPCLLFHAAEVSRASLSHLMYITMPYYMPPVLWHCWLGVRKSVRPVKIEWWGVGVVICLERGADCLHMLQLMPLHPRTPSSLALSKTTLVLPFWYRITYVVLETRPLNGCYSTSS